MKFPPRVELRPIRAGGLVRPSPATPLESWSQQRATQTEARGGRRSRSRDPPKPRWAQSSQLHRASCRVRTVDVVEWPPQWVCVEWCVGWRCNGCNGPAREDAQCSAAQACIAAAIFSWGHVGGSTGRRLGAASVVGRSAGPHVGLCAQPCGASALPASVPASTAGRGHPRHVAAVALLRFHSRTSGVRVWSATTIRQYREAGTIPVVAASLRQTPQKRECFEGEGYCGVPPRELQGESRF